mmetsp:Transcript_22163/g.54850  ORF Transcript_22163/g.54850 Transcript_22163/m.54850 type:complete len:211 (-) Transcript_22163:1034-1666(-)
MQQIWWKRCQAQKSINRGFPRPPWRILSLPFRKQSAKSAPRGFGYESATIAESRRTREVVTRRTHQRNHPKCYCWSRMPVISETRTILGQMSTNRRLPRTRAKLRRRRRRHNLAIPIQIPTFMRSDIPKTMAAVRWGLQKFNERLAAAFIATKQEPSLRRILQWISTTASRRTLLVAFTARPTWHSRPNETLWAGRRFRKNTIFMSSIWA